jgi:hypothetical protein
MKTGKTAQSKTGWIITDRPYMIAISNVAPGKTGKKYLERVSKIGSASN